MLRPKTLHSNIWKMYLSYIFQNFFFCIPVIVLFWGDNGLTLTEIMILQSLSSIMIVILEVPTGYIADIFGRKQSLIFAAISFLIAIILLSIGHSFVDFLIAEIFFALSVSMQSGADSALVYDTLLEEGEESKYKKIWGNYVMAGMFALGFSNILGGFIAKYDIRWTIYASIPFFLFATIITFTLKEPPRHKHIFAKGYLWELLKIMKESLGHNKKLRWIMLLSGFIFAMNLSGLWLYQPYFEISGLDIFYFGIVFASFHIVSGIASKFAHAIEEKLKMKLSFLVMILFMAVGYIFMSKIVFWWSFFFVFLFQFVRGFSQPIISDAVNKLTESSVRATVLSLQSLMGRLMYALIIPFIGLIADVYTVTQALLVLGITTFVIGMFFFLLLLRNRVI